MCNTKKRDSNLEMLRIISMILIVAHHYAVHGFNNVQLYYSFNKYVVDILSLGGKVGVICFILISGYFMINGKFTIKKLWKLEGQVLFYSLGMYVLFSTVLEPVYKIDDKAIKTSFYPIAYSQYWFITCYVVIMILSPYINKFIHCMEKKELKKFLIIMIILWPVTMTFLGGSFAFNHLGWLIVLYIMAAYINLYVKFDSKAIKKNKIIMIVSIALLVLSPVIYNTLWKITRIDDYLNSSRDLASISSILVLIVSVSMFIYFLNKKRYSSNIINNISKCTLGVYLIHENTFFRPYLWEKILKNDSYYSSRMLIVHAILSIIIVYVIASIIDYIRMKLIEPLWMKLYDYFENKLKKKKNSIKLLN